MVVKLIIVALLYIGLHIGLWKFFEKARYKAWYSLVPILDLWIWMKILKKPWWWILILMIPGVNVVMFAVILWNTAECYGKDAVGERLACVFLFPVVLPMWGLDPKLRFLGPDTGRKKSTGEEWTEAIVFAVIAATIIRTFFIEAFQIPTSSMEKSLMVGDYLFVSKVSYGARSPMTPLTIPFTHSTMPLTSDVPSYVEWVTLPYFRLPGLGHVERGDVVVFNFPEGDTVSAKHSNETYYQLIRNEGIRAYYGDTLRYKGKGISFMDNIGRQTVAKNKQEYGKIMYKPVDKRDHYVKRCVGLPGDNIVIKNDTLIVNGQVQEFPPNAQLRYSVASRSNNSLRKLGSTNEDIIRIYNQGGGLPIPFSKLTEYAKVAKINGKVNYQPDDISRSVLPHDTALARWTVQNFGPLHIPKAGETIELTPINLALYSRCISPYEGNTLEIKDGKAIINGQPATSYTFKQDYYWMMGDNRHGSLDSRFWGFVPNDHVVGKPVMVWMSMDPDGRFPMNIRWNRLISFVTKDGTTRSYGLHFLILLALGIGLNTLYKRGKLDFLKRNK